MKFFYPVVMLIIVWSFLVDSVELQNDRRPNSIADVFQAENIEGTFVAAPLEGGDSIVYNVDRSTTQMSPASTFKILNTLVALDAGVVRSQESRFKWDGTKRGIAAWNEDQTLQSAFKVSCLWCYQEIARNVGNNRYRKALAEAGYGNQQIGAQVDQFWIDGSLRISAIEQMEFLGRLLNGETPYRAEHVDVLKSLMRDEGSPDDYTIFAKTGWTGSKLAVGWYVGFVQKDNKVWLFAMNMRMDSADQAPLRKSLTLQSLHAGGVL